MRTYTAELGEVSMIDATHICSLLDEAVEALEKKSIPAEDFVRSKLSGLVAKTLPEYHNSVFYVNKNGEIIVEIEKHTAWCRYSNFWEVLSDKYSMKYDDIKSLIKPILEEALMCSGVTPVASVGIESNLLEEALMCRGVTPQ